MTIEFGKTGRGFAIGKFVDRYGMSCNIQKSSLAEEDCIWLGVADPESEASPRMHLTQEMTADLLPPLAHFATTGDLAQSHGHRLYLAAPEMLAALLAVMMCEAASAELAKVDMPGKATSVFDGVLAAIAKAGG